MYNKTLFQQAGIDSAPKTWEEFLDVCAKLKEAGIVPLTVTMPIWLFHSAPISPV